MSTAESAPVSHGLMSRRRFLQTGCLATAAVGLAVGGIGYVTTTPDYSLIPMPSISFGDSAAGNRLLIAYASATGSTAEVAVAIGQAFGAHGRNVDIKPIKENPALDGYESALLGSAVQYGSWLPDAVAYVTANKEALARLPVALFSVHIQNLGDDITSRQNRSAYLDRVRPFVSPVDEAFFAGRFDRRGAVLLLSEMIGRFVPTMDLRDWEKIRAWPEYVLPKLVHEA